MVVHSCIIVHGCIISIVCDATRKTTNHLPKFFILCYVSCILNQSCFFSTSSKKTSEVAASPPPRLSPSLLSAFLSFLKWFDTRNAKSRLCSKFNRGSQNVWYLNGNSFSTNSILPPRHSVTENPSSFISPVNSRLTPLSRELHSAWIRRHIVSSRTMLLKCRVLWPVVLDTWVFPCMGSQTQMTG